MQNSSLAQQQDSTPNNKRTGLRITWFAMASVAIWYALFSGGCSAPPSARCNQDVCEVTINRACTANEDCCCSQSCTNGRCTPSGNGGETSTGENGTERNQVDTAQDGAPDTPKNDAPKADNPPADNPPADNPPVDNPPVDNPPADNPLFDDPPADNPPADVPGGPCQGDETRACYGGPDGTKGVGPCKAGTQKCQNGQWGPCEEQITPTKETCDGQDNNCNGKVDEDFGNVGQDCTAGKGECEAKGKLVCKADGSGVECDAKPGKPSKETCDKKDNNCDGNIDEGCNCTNGDSRECYSGKTGCKTDGTNYKCFPPCKVGKQACTNGAWGKCVGELLPAQEKCNGQDDDCDGKVDNGFADKGKACSIGQNNCKSSGTFVCKADGSGVECNAKPNNGTTEKCNGQDDDCDGDIDEDFPNKGKACTAGLGSCANQGKFVCKGDGSGVECDAKPKQPTVELCNGQDDDCDGKTDEDFSNKGQNCATGVGECRSTGKFVCRPDKQGTLCNAVAKAPKIEECNNKDDNCNGQIDEDVRRACYSGPSGTAYVGICRPGSQACTRGQWGSCQGQFTRQSERCSSFLDEDCDGQVNEGCRCNRGDQRSCGTGTGACSRGTIRCGNNGRWGSCQNATGPKEEVCDNQDNDCDGFTDELWPAKGRSCAVGVGDCRRTGRYTCRSDGKGLVCNVAAGQPKRESCDGKDNDCDGVIDNGCP